MKTGIFLTALLFICMGSSMHGQQDYIWAKSAGGTKKENATSVCTDNKGNVLVAGIFFSPTIAFGSRVLVNPNSDNNGSELFIVKYDGSGNVVWATAGQGSSIKGVSGICTDASDNIFVTGSEAAGSASAFIMKYDANGSVLWKRGAAGLNSEGDCVCTDPNGNSYMAGSFCCAELTFGNITVTNPHLNGPFPKPDLFVVKYDASGNALWAKSAGGYDVDYAKAVCSDASGNLYVTGSFATDTISFGSLGLHNEGYYDIFIVKYDAAGKELWVRNEGGTGGTGGTEGEGLCTDKEGNLLVTGFLKWHDGNFGGISLKNAGDTDAFIIKYDPSGKVIWARGAGGSKGEEGYEVATDAGNNVYVTGDFQSPTLTFGSAVLVDGGRYNTFITKYDAAGNVIWAKGTGGAEEDFGNSVSTDINGNVYVAGYFQSPELKFGAIDLKNEDPDGKSWDMYIVKMGTPNGVEEIGDQQEVSVFPNPSNNRITINVSLNFIGSAYHIYDCVGQELLRGKINAEKTTIGLEHLSAGLYLIGVEGKQNQLIKVVKE